MVTSVVFVQATVSIVQTKLSLPSKFLRNLGSIPNMSVPLLSTSKKAYDQVLDEKLPEECGRNTVLTVSCYFMLSHCSFCHKSVSAELNHNSLP